MTGVIDLYLSFLNHLRKSKERIAVLPLSGKFEDYLVKEFAYHVQRSSKGSVFCMANCGKTKGSKHDNKGDGKDKDAHKVDICLFRKKGNDIVQVHEFSKNDFDKVEIFGMMEAKHFSNKDHIDANEGELYDFLDLYRKLETHPKKTQGGYIVNLYSKRRRIYGLLFVTYYDEREKGQECKKAKEEWFTKVSDYAKGNWRRKRQSQCFRSYKSNQPYLNSVFEDVEVRLFDSLVYVSLRTGLWIPRRR